MLFRINAVAALMSVMFASSATAMVTASYTSGTVGNFTEDASVLAPVSNSDFVNGAIDGGPANSNGVTLALSGAGVFGSNGGVSDGIYLGGAFTSVTAAGWFINATQTATYTFAGPVDFHGGHISIYSAHQSSAGDLDVLIEANTGSGFTTLVDAGVGGNANGENLLETSALFLNGVTALRFTFDTTNVVSGFSFIREIDVFTTPEPSTGLLAAFGMTGLVMRRRRKRGQ